MDAEERRVELLNTARKLFYELGYDRTSVQAIADAAGVAKGTFYHYFESKEDLLRQLTDWLAEDFFARLREVVEIEDTALEELRAVMGFITAWKAENRDLVMTYLKALYREENTVLRHSMEDSYSAKLIPYFAHTVAQGVEEGVFDVEDPVETSELLVSLARHGLSERVAPLMLALEEHPEHIELIVKKVEAVDVAIGRVLGIKDKAFRVYELATVRRILVPEGQQLHMSVEDVG